MEATPTPPMPRRKASLGKLIDLRRLLDSGSKQPTQAITRFALLPSAGGGVQSLHSVLGEGRRSQVF